MPDPGGPLFPGYTVVRELGRGGSGAVFLVRTALGEEVALKLLAPGRSELAGGRFAREQRLQAQLGEEGGFVPVIASGTCELGPFFVMPYFAAGTLRDRFDERGTLPVSEAVALGRELARALSRAHELGIVHRDLKPENILFTSAGLPLIADLGLAKHFDREVPGATRSVALSKSDEFLGTLGYMSPEQMCSARDVGPATDVFAVGAILYEALAGIAPFADASVAETIARAESGRVTPLRELRPEVPRWLEAVVTRCLRPDPARRFRDADALRDALSGGRASFGWRAAAVVAAVGLVALVALAAAGAAVSATPGAPPASPAPSPSRSPTPRAAPPRPRIPAGRLLWLHPAEVCTVCWSRERITSSCLDGRLRVWDPLTGDLRRTLTNTTWPYSGDQVDAVLLIGGPAGELELWDFESGERTFATRAERSTILSVSLAPAGKGRWRALSAGATVRLWDLPAGTSSVVEAPPRACSVRFAPDARHAAIASLSGRLVYRDLVTGRALWELREGSSTQFQPVVFSRDGRRVLTESESFGLRLADASTGAILWNVAAHAAEILSLEISPDGTRALSGSVDGTLKLWDARKGTLVRTIDTTKRVASVAFSPDGTAAVTGGGETRPRFWDLATGHEIVPD